MRTWKWYDFALAVAVIAGFCMVAQTAHADPLQWQIPSLGTINLNLQTTEVGPGFDAINKQALGFVSLPIYSTPKNILTVLVGADGAWPTGNSPLVEPSIMAGHDILREIPGLSQFTNAHLNVFASWNTTGRGRAVRLGPNFTYAFGGSTPAPASN